MKLECNCKNISIEWTIKEETIYSRVCSCNYCQTQQAEYVSDSDSSFIYYIKDFKKHNLIRHGHETADFHECRNCGLAFATCEIEGNQYGIINAKVMGFNNCTLESNARDYSGETINDRLARRKENWCKVNS